MTGFLQLTELTVMFGGGVVSGDATDKTAVERDSYQARDHYSQQFLHL